MPLTRSSESCTLCCCCCETQTESFLNCRWTSLITIHEWFSSAKRLNPPSEERWSSLQTYRRTLMHTRRIGDAQITLRFFPPCRLASSFVRPLFQLPYWSCCLSSRQYQAEGCCTNINAKESDNQKQKARVAFTVDSVSPRHYVTERLRRIFIVICVVPTTIHSFLFRNVTRVSNGDQWECRWWPSSTLHNQQWDTRINETIDCNISG